MQAMSMAGDRLLRRAYAARSDRWEIPGKLSTTEELSTALSLGRIALMRKYYQKIDGAFFSSTVSPATEAFWSIRPVDMRCPRSNFVLLSSGQIAVHGKSPAHHRIPP